MDVWDEKIKKNEEEKLTIRDIEPESENEAGREGKTNNNNNTNHSKRKKITRLETTKECIRLYRLSLLLYSFSFLSISFFIFLAICELSRSF